MAMLPDTPWIFGHGKNVDNSDYYIKARFYNRIGESVDKVTSEKFESIEITKDEYDQK